MSIEDIPPDTAAALLLVEHHWAVPLRDAIMRANGFRIADGFISPLDLVEIGLLLATRRPSSFQQAIEKGTKPAPTAFARRTAMMGSRRSRPTHLTTRRPTPLTTSTNQATRADTHSRVGAGRVHGSSLP